MNERTKTLLIGFGAGLATAAAIPFLLPLLSEIARPVTKAAIKHGLLGLDRLRTGTARASEALEDLLAEVRAEVEQELGSRHGVATPEVEAATATAASPNKDMS